MSRVGSVSGLVKEMAREMILEIVTARGSGGHQLLVPVTGWELFLRSRPIHSPKTCVITSEVRPDIGLQERGELCQDAVDWNMEPCQYIHASPVIRWKTVKWFCSEAILHWLYFAELLRGSINTSGQDETVKLVIETIVFAHQTHCIPQIGSCANFIPLCFSSSPDIHKQQGSHFCAQQDSQIVTEWEYEGDDDMLDTEQ